MVLKVQEELHNLVRDNILKSNLFGLFLFGLTDNALLREAKEELNILINTNDIEKEYVVLRRNYFQIDGKILEPYIDYYFEITKYEGIPTIMEEDKCDELIWININDLPEPFINYEGDFLDNKNIKAYDCLKDGAYIKKKSLI